MDNTNKDLYVEANEYSNAVEEEITETKESVAEILDTNDTIEDTIKKDKVINEAPSGEKVAIRMTSGYKGRKSGDDYLVTKKELKAIPKFKYKLI